MEKGYQSQMPDHGGGAGPTEPLRDLREMWRALLACDWQSMAIIPTDPGVSVHHVVAAFQSEVESLGEPVRFIDARGADVADGKRLAQDMASARSARSRAVVVVDSLLHSLSGVHLVQQASVVLLVIHVGAIDLDSLASTVSIVGAERVVGSVAAPMPG